MTYRFSALGSAALRMWRGWSVIVPVVVVNAALQALLVSPAVTIDSGLLLGVLAVASYVVLLLAYGLVVAVALGVPDGRVGWPAAVARLRARALPFALWTTGLAVVVVLGWAFYAVPGVLVLAASVFVPFAALDARGSPLRRALGVVRRRLWRWLGTLVVVGLVCFVGSLVAGFTVFFLRGALGSAVVWLVAGLVLAWVTVGWGLVYRSAMDEAAHAAPVAVGAEDA